jgi:hypothetical protein
VSAIRDEDKGKGKCSPLHSPTNSSGNGNRASRFNEQGTPDMAEEKETDRERDGRFAPRDNNIEDVNMSMVGAKSGDKSADAPTAKEASPSSRSGSKMETTASDEHGRQGQEPQAVTEGLGAMSILAPRGDSCLTLVFLQVPVMLVPHHHNWHCK